MLIDLETNTLAVLIAGLYCESHRVDAQAIPQSIWLEVAEKLEYFLPAWDYEKITFEDWIENGLMIYPVQLFDENTLQEIKETTLYWERVNGNALLFVSMDIESINNQLSEM